MTGTILHHWLKLNLFASLFHPLDFIFVSCLKILHIFNTKSIRNEIGYEVIRKQLKSLVWGIKNTFQLMEKGKSRDSLDDTKQLILVLSNGQEENETISLLRHAERCLALISKWLSTEKIFFFSYICEAATRHRQPSLSIEQLKEATEGENLIQKKQQQ